jgi:transposase
LVDRFVDELDRKVLDDLYRGVGLEAHDPILMLKLGVYGWLQGNGSPAKWYKLATDSKSMQWLIRGIRPSRSCCYNFRDRVGAVIQNLVSQVVTKAVEEGLVEPKMGIQDGTTFRAAASRHRVVNTKTLTRRQETLVQAIQQDQKGIPIEDAPKWMARTPGGRLEQQQRYEKAAQVLAQRQQENATKRKDRRLADDKVQVSLSEPEAPLGRDKERVFCALYTAQCVVEPSSLLILTYDVFAQTTDAGSLPIMADATQKVLGYYLDTMVADGAYASLLDLRACAAREIELIAGPEAPAKNNQAKTSKKPAKLDKSEFTWLPEEQMYRCPEGHLLKYCQKDRVHRRGGESLVELRFQCPPEHCLGCPRRANCVDNPAKGRVIKRLEGQELLDAHHEKMKTDRAKAVYKLRGQVVERSFADAKQHRQGRRLHGRGLLRAKAEIGLMVLTQNLLTLMRLRKNRENPETQTT